MNTLATVGATGTWTHRAGESPRGKTAYFAGSFRKLDHLHQFSRQKTPQTEPQTTPCFAGATSNRTTPSGFAVHPSTEGNEQQSASKAGRSPLTRGVSRRKLSGIPKGPRSWRATRRPSAWQGRWVQMPAGSPGSSGPFGAWIQGPGMRVLGPEGFTGASGHAPVESSPPA